MLLCVFAKCGTVLPFLIFAVNLPRVVALDHEKALLKITFRVLDMSENQSKSYLSSFYHLFVSSVNHYFSLPAYAFT